MTAPTYPGHAGDPIAYLDFDPTGTPADGAPVVIVHGTMSVADDWTEVARNLAATGRRVLVPYLRGRTPSPDLGPDFTLDVAVRDLHALLDRTGPGTRVIGHSLGGIVAALAATDRADLGPLVLYEPPLPFDRPVAGRALDRIRAALDAGDVDLANRIIVTDVVGESAATARAVQEDPAWPARRVLVPSSLIEIAAVDALFGIEPERFTPITAPTTVLLGELTDRPPLGTPARLLAAAVPGARLVELPGQNHIAHVLAPDQLAAAVLAAWDPHRSHRISEVSATA